MRQFGPHPHHSAFGGGAALGVGCSGAWGSIFMGGLELVAAVALLVGGSANPFLVQRGSLTFFLPRARGASMNWDVF